MKKDIVLIALTSTNFPDRAFLAEVCRVLGAAPGDRVSASSFSKVTSLDVSNCGIHKLKGLAFFTELKELYCSGNHLVQLDVTCCPMLETVSCGHNELTRLTVHGCRKLYTLICDSNCLCSLNLAGCGSLRELLCGNNMLHTFDEKIIGQLDMLWCRGNPTKLRDIVPAGDNSILPVNSAC